MSQKKSEYYIKSIIKVRKKIEVINVFAILWNKLNKSVKIKFIMLQIQIFSIRDKFRYIVLEDHI